MDALGRLFHTQREVFVRGRRALELDAYPHGSPEAGLYECPPPSFQLLNLSTST